MDVDADVDMNASGPSSGPSTSAMDLHRVRFVDWAPSRITAMAFSPPSPLKPAERSVLAVGRENGNIDLCVWTEDSQDQAPASLAKGWLVDTTLVGNGDSKIDSIAFVLCPTQPRPTLRLFSTSGGPLLTEHFLPPHLSSWPSSDNSPGFVTAAMAAQSSKALALAGTTRTLPSNGGSIWALAPSPLGKKLAIACQDGHVRIVDIEDGRFEHYIVSRRIASQGGHRGIGVHMLDRVKYRVVSLAWGPPRRTTPKQTKTNRAIDSDTDSDSDSDSDSDDDEELWQDSFLVGGTASSCGLVWDLATGRMVDKVLVDRSRFEQTIVWSVLALGDGTLVFGDSMGNVTFFEAKTRTAISGGQFSGHKRSADVLTLCAGPDGKSVYSGSVDQNVVEYALVEGDSQRARWIQTGSRRLHAHDVKALAIDPPFSPLVGGSDRLPILVSGGVDFHLVLTPAASPSQTYNPISNSPITSFAETVQRRIAYVPPTSKGGALGGGGAISVCEGKRWILLRRETSDAPTGDQWVKLLEMDLKVKTNLVALAISPDGRFLAVSDLYETKLFSLQTVGDGILPRRVSAFSKAFGEGAGGAPGSSAMTFTPDSSRLVLATYPGSYVHVVELPTEDTAPRCRIVASFSQHRSREAGRAVAGKKLTNGHAHSNGHANGVDSDSESGSEAEEETEPETRQRTQFARLDLVQVSPDGQYLVSVDTSRRIHVFSLDTLRHHGALPSPPTVPSCITFDPARPSRMLLVLPTNKTQLVDVESPLQQDALGFEMPLHKRLAGVRDHAVGAIWLAKTAARPETILTWGPAWLCAVKKGSSASLATPSSKRARDGNSQGSAESALASWSCNMTFDYQSILHVGLLLSKKQDGAEEELLVVERPSFDLAHLQPPVFHRGAKYGH
ncbi:hypothetical protein FA10DRAFT_271280 [Acaromyces ingoldii]|uniref:Anaphase-promoting complex subunit 4-like WD40 domain-containing protein n=1 Tax=Acaromyces ingoldii TaxID=215250 RepID=A0A316YU37_9BASI|nr:hypothetical protein FA10DRAFT_271280 [Acaromyces ingoldii]PWN91543.1 hypothetical protein FA10DRAFT_271280 [Acaromyces ingoldii]